MRKRKNRWVDFPRQRSILRGTSRTLSKALYRAPCILITAHRLNRAFIATCVSPHSPCTQSRTIYVPVSSGNTLRRMLKCCCTASRVSLNFKTVFILRFANALMAYYHSFIALELATRRSAHSYLFHKTLKGAV